MKIILEISAQHFHVCTFLIFDSIKGGFNFRVPHGLKAFDLEQNSSLLNVCSTGLILWLQWGQFCLIGHNLLKLYEHVTF